MIGVQIGGYRVVEHLADGGMGAVYVARHELLHREAVVKVLLPEFSANQGIIRRFLNEARAATQIHHPGIVEVFEVGFLPSGPAFIVMEKLRGESLAARLQRGRFSIDQAVALTRQLAGALGAAHEVGIVHRDLKPDNLFLTPDPTVRDPIVPGGERLKVLDFGIAKIAQASETSATVAGAIFGTPPYMSPEQCTSSGDVDARSDLYAIGCILYEVLCGTPPFGTGGQELLAAQLRDTPRAPRLYLPSLPAWLEATLLRLLEKDPARRPQSSRALIAEIDHALAGDPRSSLATTLTEGPSPGVAQVAAAVPVQTPLAGQQVSASRPARRTTAVGAALVGLIAIASAIGFFIVTSTPGDRTTPPMSTDAGGAVHAPAVDVTLAAPQLDAAHIEAAADTGLMDAGEPDGSSPPIDGSHAGADATRRRSPAGDARAPEYDGPDAAGRNVYREY